MARKHVDLSHLDETLSSVPSVISSSKHPDEVETVKTPVPEPTPALPARVTSHQELVAGIDELVRKRASGQDVGLADLQALQSLAKG